MLELGSSPLSSISGTGTGRFTDGTLVVDVENYDGSSFDWRSNIGVSSVFVRISGGGVFYNYDPKSKSDESLSGNGAITDLSFCYSPAQPTPTPTPEQTPTPTPTPPDTAVELFDSTTGGTGTGALLAIVLISLAAALVVAGGTRRRMVRRVPSPALSGRSPWSTERIQH